jgi:hypothetical protein
MPDLKLARLPDRVPIKYTFSVSPKLNRCLTLYAELYREIYGEAESIPTLVPFMLQTFLDGDRAFQKALRDRFATDGTGNAGSTTRRQSGRTSATSS